MYPYHNRCMQRIKNGEAISVEKGEGEFAMVLVFCTPPYRRPVRERSLYRYEKVFAERGMTFPERTT